MSKRIERWLLLVLLALIVLLVNDLREASERQEENVQTETRCDTDGLPSRHDARLAGKMTTVKDQGGLGTCWAVAASSALEAYLLPEEQLVFSADHISMQNHFAQGQNDGGGYAMVMAYLAGWQGPVLEDADPYGDGVSPDGLPPVKHVQEIRMYRDRDFEAIKWAVLRYGAVQSALYMDLRNAEATSVYYQPRSASYCYDGAEPANHDVLIIGWDDDYPAEYFPRPVAQNGAFLCQNSWGRGFGDDGIFYVSYEDAHLGETAIGCSRIEETDNYDHLYETDLCGWVGQLGYGEESCYFANVFTARRTETLEAVGFYATGKKTEYEIYILEECAQPGTVLIERAAAKGVLPDIGYYTVALDVPVGLYDGEEYTVVVKICTPGAELPVAIEQAADEFTKTVDISDGAGYISHNGVSWTDTEEKYACNVCMKAYTKDSDGR